MYSPDITSGDFLYFENFWKFAAFFNTAPTVIYERSILNIKRRDEHDRNGTERAFS